MVNGGEKEVLEQPVGIRNFSKTLVNSQKQVNTFYVWKAKTKNKNINTIAKLHEIIDSKLV